MVDSTKRGWEPGRPSAASIVRAVLALLLSVGVMARAAADDAPRLSWDTGAGKSYLVPLGEIISYELLLNQYDRNFIDRNTYGSTPSSIAHNFRHGWVVDTDPFQINQFEHPYGGNIYYGLARSSGLNYWESLGYAAGGSLLWEYAGERTQPSINDQVTTTFAGSFLGEPLFRMAGLLLEGGGSHPGFFRELGAAVLSPSTGFNRLVFGDRFGAIFPSHDPAYFARLQLGGQISANVRSNVNLNANLASGEPSVNQTVKRDQAIADFALSYGLPGKPGYRYDRPFDYFNFEFSAVTANIISNILVRGLLYGSTYETARSRGIWGLYGSYDYVAPQIFRVSSTAASFGETGEWWPMRGLSVQSTALAGVGYGAAGTIHGSGERNYHYGLTPQTLLSGRLTFRDRVQFDLTARQYYVSGVASTEHRGHENIYRADSTITLRVYNRHAFAVRYIDAFRDARYPDLRPTHQHVGTWALFYTYLGDSGLGTVDWRKAETGKPAQPHDSEGDHLP